MASLKDLLNSGKYGHLKTNNISTQSDILNEYLNAQSNNLTNNSIQNSIQITNKLSENTKQQPPGTQNNVSSVEVKNYLMEVIQKTFEKNGMLKYFYNQLFNKQYMPDINGFTLIYMVPPHLSGFVKTDPITQQSGFFRDISKMSVFLALDASPPSSSVSYEEISGSSTSVVYASETKVSKQVSVSYIDNINLSMYSLHKIWIDYIRVLQIGEMEPDESYLSGDFAELDYVATVYFIRFKPTIVNGDFFKNITFLGKAVGLFPIDLPDKEILGRRDSNELTLVPINYACSEYRQYTINEAANPTNSNFFWVLYDFISDVKDLYGIETDIVVPQMDDPHNQLNTEIKLTEAIKKETTPTGTNTDGSQATSSNPDNETPITPPPSTSIQPGFPTGMDLKPTFGVNSPYKGESGDYAGTFSPVEAMAQQAKAEGYRITARKENGHSTNSTHNTANKTAYAIDIGLGDKTKEQSDALAVKMLRQMTGDPNLQLNSGSQFEGNNASNGKYYSTIKTGENGKKYEYTMFYSGKNQSACKNDNLHQCHIHFHVKTPPYIQKAET